MWTVDLLEKTLMLGKTEGRRRREAENEMLDSLTDSLDMNLGKLRETVEGQAGLVCCSPWGHKESRHNLVTEQ